MRGIDRGSVAEDGNALTNELVNQAGLLRDSLSPSDFYCLAGELVAVGLDAARDHGGLGLVGREVEALVGSGPALAGRFSFESKLNSELTVSPLANHARDGVWERHVSGQLIADRAGRDERQLLAPAMLVVIDVDGGVAAWCLWDADTPHGAATVKRHPCDPAK